MGEKVAVILLNWHGADDTIACLKSLLMLDLENFGIFVCDNASTDNSVANIRAWCNSGLAKANDDRLKRSQSTFEFRDLSHTASDGKSQLSSTASTSIITLIQTGHNGGFAAGNNVGLRHALAEGFDYFWILNNDTEVEPDAVYWLLRRMSEDDKIGMCGSTVIYASRRDIVQNWGGAEFLRFKGRGVQLGAKKSSSDPVDQSGIEKRLGYICGAAMFVSKPFLEDIGLMQEDYFLYWEEMDWAARARGKYKLGYASRSLVYHKVGASIGTNDFGDRSPLSDFYMSRSRVKFCWRFSKISLPFVFADISRQAVRWAARGRLNRALLLVRAALGLPYVKPE